MNLFKIKTSWSVWELGLVKACLVSLGTAVGAYFHSYFEQYVILFLVIYLVSALWLGYLWINKTKEMEK